jgi:phosphatidylserine/phosphatidylglycerophosphate/cardiolipin synthase-like enzyme
MIHRPGAQRRGGVLRVVVLALLLLVALYLYQSGRLQTVLAGAAARVGLIQPPVQAGALRAIFTTPDLIYPDTPRQRTSSRLLEAVRADLEAARASIDLATFDFDVAELTDALLRADRRGVAVRLIVDSENLEAPEVAEQTARLERAGVTVRFDRREPFMHDKGE